MSDHFYSVCCVAWSFDGYSIVSGSGDGNIIVWDAQTGKEKLKFDGHSDHVTSVAWSPNNLMIVSSSEDDTIRVWDAETC